jgi:tetratricopeptide (TPR) repeat protein
MPMKNNDISKNQGPMIRSEKSFAWLVSALAGVVFSGMILFGCSGTRPQVAVQKPSDPSPAPSEAQTGVQSGNSFYFYAQSQLWLKQSNLDKAVESLRQAIMLDPEDSFLKRELAQVYWQKKDAAAADALVTDLMSKDPDNLENLILFAKIKHGSNEPDEAKSAYEKIIARDPTQKNIYMLLGGLYMDENNTEFAIQVYRKMIHQFPEDFAGYYLMAHAQAQGGNSLEAEQNFLKAIQLEPELDEARFELIELYKTRYPFYRLITVKPGETIESISRRLYKTYNKRIQEAVLRLNPELRKIDKVATGQKIKFPQAEVNAPGGKNRRGVEKIIDLYREILDKNPHHIRASLEAGYFYWQLGRFEEAAEIFTALGERSQTDKQVIQQVLQLYLDQQKFDQALVILNLMRSGAPESSEIYYIMGIAYDGKKEYASAIIYLKRVDPDSRFFQSAVTHIAFLYQQMGKTEEAIAYLEKVINERPRLVEPRLYLGALYEETQMYEDAEAVLKEGIGIAPDNSNLYFRLGVVYDKWGKKNDAIGMMKEALRLDPKDYNALNYLGYTYADMGIELDEAERLVREALKYKPGDGYIIDSLGWIYFKKGDYEKALMYLKNAAQLASEDPTILEHLGDVYLKIGDPKKALEIYRQSLMNATEGKENIEKKIKELIDQGY